MTAAKPKLHLNGVWRLLARGMTIEQAADQLNVDYEELYLYVEKEKEDLSITPEEIEYQRKIAAEKYDDQYTMLMELIENELDRDPKKQRPYVVIGAVKELTKITRQKGSLYGIEQQNPDNKKALEEQRAKDVKLMQMLGLKLQLPSAQPVLEGEVIIEHDSTVNASP